MSDRKDGYQLIAEILDAATVEPGQGPKDGPAWDVVRDVARAMRAAAKVPPTHDTQINGQAEPTK